MKPPNLFLYSENPTTKLQPDPAESFHALTSFTFKTNFNLFFPPTLNSSKLYLTFGISDQIFAYVFYLHYACYTFYPLFFSV